MAGAVSVGLYPTSAPAQVAQLLADCGATIVVADRTLRARVPAEELAVGDEVGLSFAPNYLLFFDPDSPIVEQAMPLSFDDPRILMHLRAREAAAGTTR